MTPSVMYKKYRYDLKRITLDGCIFEVYHTMIVARKIYFVILHRRRLTSYKHLHDDSFAAAFGSWLGSLGSTGFGSITEH